MRKSITKTITLAILILTAAIGLLALLPGCGQADQEGAGADAAAVQASDGQNATGPASEGMAPDALAAQAQSAQAQPEEYLTPALDDRERAQRQADVTRLRNAQKPVPAEDFARSRPELLLSKCRTTGKGVRLQWREVPGATGYQVVRAESIDGEYALFAETAEPVLKTADEGEGYYKVRALQGETSSRWSLTLQTCSVSGYVEKMYYGKKGFTHFRLKVTNRTDRPVWLLGPGLYDAATDPQYYLEKYDSQTYERQGAPYPMTAALRAKTGQRIQIPARAEDQAIDIYLPQRLAWLGESGLHALPAEDADRVNVTDRSYGYRICVTFYPEGDGPAFVLNATEEASASRTPARIAH